MAKMKINVKQEAAGRLPFVPFIEHDNLCLGYLTGVRLVESEIKADSKWEFSGMKITSLVFDFVQYKANAIEKDRFHTESELPIANVLSTGEPRAAATIEKDFNDLFLRVKHIHDQFAGSPNYKAFDVDLEVEVDGPAKKRLDSQKALFTALADAFNKGLDGETPIYSTKVLLAMKLIATERKANNGKKFRQLLLPRYVGKGTVEAVRIDKQTGKMHYTLVFKPGESVDLKGKVVQPLIEGDSVANSELSDNLKKELGIA